MVNSTGRLTSAQYTEVQLRRRLLLSFINADPVQISFVRFEQTSDGAGGWVRNNPRTLAAQTMRLVPYKRRLTTLTMHTEHGDIPDVQYSLIGRWDCDVQRWDECIYNGAWYKVMGMEPNSERTEFNDRVVILIDIRDKPAVTKT